MAHKCINTRYLIKSNGHWRYIQWVLFYKTKRFCFGKNVIDEFSHFAYAYVRESVRNRDMDMISHVSFITCRISGRNLNVLLGMCVLLCEHGIVCTLRWGVTLIGVYSTELCSPRHGTPFQVVQAVDPHLGLQA